MTKTVSVWDFMGIDYSTEKLYVLSDPSITFEYSEYQKVHEAWAATGMPYSELITMMKDRFVLLEDPFSEVDGFMDAM